MRLRVRNEEEDDAGENVADGDSEFSSEQLEGVTNEEGRDQAERQRVYCKVASLHTDLLAWYVEIVFFRQHVRQLRIHVHANHHGRARQEKY